MGPRRAALAEVRANAAVGVGKDEDPFSAERVRWCGHGHLIVRPELGKVVEDPNGAARQVIRGDEVAAPVGPA